MFNQILLAGRLVFEPKLVEVDDNKKVCQIRIAVARPFRSRETQEFETDFFNVVLWQGMAQQVANNCKVGSVIIVKGRLEENKYENKEGRKVNEVRIIGEKIIYVSQNNITNEVSSEED